MPCRQLAKENPRAWQLEASPFFFQSVCISFASSSFLPPPLKKGGYPCVEYTACNFAVKLQLGGQCCDWLCKDLSLKGNYTKFPSEGQLSLDRIQEKPHIIPLFIEILGSLWLSPTLLQRDTLRRSDSSKLSRVTSLKATGKYSQTARERAPEGSVWGPEVLGGPEGAWLHLECLCFI